MAERIYLGNVKGEKGDKGEPGSGLHASALENGAYGDGITNDTIAIQTTLNTFKELYLPDGFTFSVSDIVLENAKIYGGGTLKLKSNSSRLLNILGQSIIDGVVLDGNKSEQNNTLNTHILLNNADNAVIKNSVIKNFKGHTLSAEYNTSDTVNIINNIFEENSEINGGNVLNVKGSQWLIEGNTFNNIGEGHCIRIGANGSDLPVSNNIEQTRISNNTFKDTLHNNITIELHGVNTIVTGNTFDTAPQAIKCDNGGTAYGLIATNNIIKNIYLNTALNLSMAGVSFINNKCYDLNGGAYFGNDFICSNNTFERCGENTSSGYVISNFNGSVKGTVTGNIINNSKNRGIVIGSQSTVTDNIISHTPDSGIRFAGEHTIISKNVIHNALTGLLMVSTSNNFIVKDNIFKECGTPIQHSNNENFNTGILSDNIGGI